MAKTQLVIGVDTNADRYVAVVLDMSERPWWTRSSAGLRLHR